MVINRGFGALAPLAGRIDATEEMWQATGIAQDLAGQVVARAHAAGVLRDDVTTPDISPLIGQFSRRGPVPEADNDENVRRLVAIAVAGLRAGVVEPLPGDPSEQREYESLWRNSWHHPSMTGVFPARPAQSMRGTTTRRRRWASENP
ncbi:hypothetical protein [Amycolatopsis decaplanina]|uniref:TetR family transcriptional regulator n=1 Tax=Amycolatopsis decaplanina DSM 44594 TaxID=1284240 RepID=M2YE65_9PSEU|nr:hypothetical protein [Amycolatopsis decaplanina]EME53142.1 TetR family transcriptional regulator [Amycolatopsis decaplanina DSM 44594]